MDGGDNRAVMTGGCNADDHHIRYGGTDGRPHQDDFGRASVAHAKRLSHAARAGVDG